MNKRRFEDVIAEQGKLIYTHVGDSMYPLIKPRDLLVIKAVSEPLKKYDIPLYKRESGQYVLHRIVGVKDGGYLICGDNRSDIEYGVTDSMIIGVLTGIIRSAKERSVYSLRYRIYARLLPVRRFFIKVRKRFK